LTQSLKYSHQWSQLQVAGVSITGEELNKDMSVKLFEFEQTNSKEYWVGLPNFYVITRYNHSPLYAMAVFQFSQQLKQEFNVATTAKLND
jgi:membrane-bound lytic murein transglycosylase B